MKRNLAIIMVILTLFFMAMPANALDGDDTESEDLVDVSEEDFSFEDEDVEPFDLVCYDPLMNYLNNDEEYAEEPADCISKENENSLISTYIITRTDEDTDKTMDLDELSADELDSKADGTAFKNIINVEGATTKNRTYLASLVKARYTDYDPIGSLYLNMQGSCSDGEYVYYAFFIADKYYRTDENGEYIIDEDGKKISVKKPLEICIVSGVFNENEEFVTTSIRFSGDIVHEDGLRAKDDLQHANDITYNSLHDKLIIACTQTGYHNIVYSIDAEYFRGTTEALPTAQRYELSCMISSIAYNEKRNKYVAMVAGADEYVVFFDSDFNLIAALNNIKDANGNGILKEARDEDLSHQGICCDENYIYATYRIVDNEDVSKENVLLVFDWSGEKISETNLNLERAEVQNSSVRCTYEIEGISILNDKIVLGFNVFWRKNTQSEKTTAFFYQYDLSHKSFNIKYCPDDNIEEHLYNTDLKSNTVLHGYSTKTLTNTYRKNGYKFAGWNLYSVETNKWRYYNEGTKTWKWCVEGTEPEGYEKGVYVEGVSVKQTVPAGTTVLFCAVWEATDKFYISFDGNGATSGAMENAEITHGVSTRIPVNTFEKEINGNRVAFVGWNPYSVETGKWYYTNSDASEKGWYIEGEEPVGFTKAVYKDNGSIKQTTNPGSHIIFFAAWNEFTIFYDSNGVLIKSAKILLPTVVNKGFSTPVKKYDTSCISIYEDNVPTSLNGYNQYLVESELWRYCSDTDSSIWLEESSNLPLYTYTYNSISNGLSAGRRVVFSADWLYA